MDDRLPARGVWLRGVLARFERPLVRYAFALTGDLERARDVVQDTFERLLNETRELTEDHLPRWLFTVCRNRAVDIKRREAQVTAVESTKIDRRESVQPGPAAVAEHNAVASALLSALDRLPPNQREVVRLKFQSGLSYKEISAVTGLSVSNVGFLIHTAVKSIRKELSR